MSHGSRDYLVTVFVLFGILLLVGGGAITGAAVKRTFWQSVSDIFTKEKIVTACDSGNISCAENAIWMQGWSRAECGDFEILGLKISTAPKQGQIVCIATDIALSDAELEKGLADGGVALLPKLATKKLRVFCCGGTACEEAKTLLVPALLPYLKSHNFDKLEADVLPDVACAESIEISV